MAHNRRRTLALAIAALAVLLTANPGRAQAAEPTEPSAVPATLVYANRAIVTNRRR